MRRIVTVRPLASVAAAAGLFVVLLGLGLGACGGDGSGPNRGGTLKHFVGVFGGTNGVEKGSLVLDLDTTGTAHSGAFRLAGAPTTLATVAVNAGQVTASGGGLSFSGAITADTIEGNYTSGTGGGRFAALAATGAAPVSAYCGTHIGALGADPIGGVFAFARGGAAVRGVFTTQLDSGFAGPVTGQTPAPDLAGLPGAVQLTLNGTATFTGTYSMVGGQIGDFAGTPCPVAVTNPGFQGFDGVFGGIDGLTSGTFGVTLSSTGEGSTGTYRTGGTTVPLTTIISGVNNKVVAFGSGLSFSGDLQNNTLDGNFVENSALAGLFASLENSGGGGGGGSFVKYCAQHAGSIGAVNFGGVFAFVQNGNAVHGVFTSGIGNAFRGFIGGFVGADSGTMSGRTGSVTILPAGGSLSGFYDFSASGGESGSMSGGTCP